METSTEKKEIKQRYSKYMNLSKEEKKEIQKKQHDEWVKKNKDKVHESNKRWHERHHGEHYSKIKEQRKGHCDVCDRDYNILPAHYKTKKHLKNSESIE